MYGAALTLSATTTAGTVGLPFFQLGELFGRIQWFGLIVAAGVLIGASILRRYGEWHGVSDDHIRGITGWITLTGFIGAHVFDVLMYQGDKNWFEFTGDVSLATLWHPNQWPLIIKLWDGISSYGGFVGGAMGFFFYVWWKRQPARLFADVAVIGLLPAFSIGRIGCTVVSDHIGAWVDPNAWYAFAAQNYPVKLNMEAVQNLVATHPHPGPTILAWNLGLIEFLYLIPVNALLLWIAFRPQKRMPAGFLVVLAGVLYAPVRFFLDFLRPEMSDPRHFGLTFAQWASMLAFGAAVAVAVRLLKTGKAAETVAPTSREAQEKLRVILKEPEATGAKGTPKGKLPAATVREKTAAEKEAEAKAKALEEERKAAQKKKDDEEEIAAAERRKRQDEELQAKERAKNEEAAAARAPIAEVPADEGAAVDSAAVADEAKPAPAAKGPKASGGKKAKPKK